MRERFIDLKIEVIVNKLLYKKNIIDQFQYQYALKQIEKMIFEENKKIKFERWLKLLSMYRIKKYQLHRIAI